MAHPEHVSILNKGVDAWNQWRDANPGYPDLSHADLAGRQLWRANFRGTVLEGANLRGSDLTGAVFELAVLKAATLEEATMLGANLAIADLREVNLRRANLGGANMSGAVLPNAILQGADLLDTNLHSATLSHANLSGARCTGTIFEKANLEDANFARAVIRDVNFEGANMRSSTFDSCVFERARLFEANLQDSNLSDARGFVFDSTFVRGARVRNPGDPWSTLRRNYTGTNFAFHILLLTLFAAPYVAKTLMWISIDRVQISLSAMLLGIAQEMEILKAEVGEESNEILQILDKLRDPRFPRELSQRVSRLQQRIKTSATSAVALLDQAAQMKPCLSDKCDEWPIWKLLLGIDRTSSDKSAWLRVMVGALLISYNICRGLLTRVVGAMRDEEDRSGYTPPYTGKNGYQWLLPIHRFMRIMITVALTSGAVSLWVDLTTTIWLPSR